MSNSFEILTNNYIKFLKDKKKELGQVGMIPWADKKKRLIDEAKELLGTYESESHRQEHFEKYARFVFSQMTPASIKAWKDKPAFGDFLCYITENHPYVRKSLDIDSAHGSVCHPLRAPLRASLFNARRRSRARSTRKKPSRKSRSRRSTKRSVKSRSKRRSRRTVKRSAKRSANRRKQSRKRSRKRR